FMTKWRKSFAIDFRLRTLPYGPQHGYAPGCSSGESVLQGLNDRPVATCGCTPKAKKARAKKPDLLCFGPDVGRHRINHCASIRISCASLECDGPVAAARIDSAGQWGPSLPPQ